MLPDLHTEQIRRSGIPISSRIFQFIEIHTVKGFGIVSKAEVDFFFFFGILLLFRRSKRCWQFDLKPKNTGVGSPSLLLGIFPNQELNTGSPVFQADSLPNEPSGKLHFS